MRMGVEIRFYSTRSQFRIAILKCITSLKTQVVWESVSDNYACYEPRAASATPVPPSNRSAKPRSVEAKDVSHFAGFRPSTPDRPSGFQAQHLPGLHRRVRQTRRAAILLEC